VKRIYLRGVWSHLKPTDVSLEYQCFSVVSEHNGNIVGKVDSRNLYPGVYQIGIEIDGNQTSGIGMDASIAIIAWLFDFLRAKAVVIVTNGDDGPLSGLFSHGIVTETARSPHFQIVDNKSQTVRWGVMDKKAFEKSNIVLQELRKRYEESGY
jgi:hypothetical protein